MFIFNFIEWWKQKKTKDLFFSLGFFLGLCLLFFYPSVLKGQLPFPGDLLVGHYAPWKTYSYLGYAPGGVPHKAQGIDVVRELFPWKHFSVEMIKQGELPFWNPYNFSGNPHLANFQSAVFYPLNFVFFLLPFNLAWTVFIFCQPLLAGFFTYWLARELKMNRLAALFSGTVFAFCLYFAVWLEYGNIGHTLLWLPLALLLTEKLVKKFDARWWSLLVLVLTLSLLAGYIQAVIYLYGTVLAYFLFRLFFLGKKRQSFKWLPVFLFFLALGLPLLLIGFQLGPTLEIFLQSSREAYPKERIPEVLLPWFYPITNFASDFFGNPASRNYWLPGTYIERVSYFGVLPFFFSLLALIKLRKSKTVLFFGGLAVLALFFSLNITPVRFFYGLKIPIISTTVYTRLLSLFSFSMAILAGFGLNAWFRAKSLKPLKKLILFFCGVYLLLWVLTLFGPRFLPSSWWVSHLKVSQRNLILPTVFFLGGLVLMSFFQRFPKKLLLWGIMAITVFDLYFYFYKITPFSPPEFIYPETEVMSFLKSQKGIDRFWSYGTAYVDSNFSTFDHSFSPEGNDPLLIRRYGELLAAAQNQGQLPPVIPRADVFLEKGFGQEDLKNNFYRQRLFDLLGVKYLLHKNEGLGETWQPDEATFDPEIYCLVWQSSPWQVYENQTVLPRVFLAGDYQVAEDDQEILDLIFTPEYPLGKRVILEEELPSDFILDSEAGGEVEILEYQPNSIKLGIKATGNQVLFLSDNYFPGWQAYLGKIPQKIYRANYSFRAVPIHKGRHVLTLVYKPDSFKRGAIISGLSLGILLSLIYLSYRKKIL